MTIWPFKEKPKTPLKIVGAHSAKHLQEKVNEWVEKQEHKCHKKNKKLVIEQMSPAPSNGQFYMYIKYRKDKLDEDNKHSRGTNGKGRRTLRSGLRRLRSTLVQGFTTVR